jgi:hypothetical protein
MTDMPTEAVTPTEIAKLTAHLRTLSPAQHGDTAARAAFLAAKADPLARIADQHAHDWPCDHAEHARQVANDARAVAERASRLAAPIGIDTEEETP